MLEASGRQPRRTGDNRRVNVGAPRENYRPGYPIDLRPASRVAKLAGGVTADFEYSAARVIARLTGERVILQDDGSQDRMADIRIEYADGRRGYAEVWTDIQPGYAATYSRLMGRERRLPRPFLIASLRRDWFVTVSGRSNLRDLEGELEALLGGLEARGETFQWVTEHETLNSFPDADVTRLVALGVVRLSSRPAESTQHGVVRMYPAGVVGPSVVQWEPVSEWIAQTLSLPRLADVQTKLASTEADERHAFLGVTFTSPGDVFFALSIDEQTLPSEPPELPRDITHLWLMNATSPGRCIAWFPDRGWLDVRRHWVTID